MAIYSQSWLLTQHLDIQGVSLLSDKSNFEVMLRKIGQMLKLKEFS